MRFLITIAVAIFPFTTSGFAQDITQSWGIQRPSSMNGQIHQFQRWQATQDESVRQWGNVVTNNATVCADGWGRRMPAGSGYCPLGTRPVH